MTWRREWDQKIETEEEEDRRRKGQSEVGGSGEVSGNNLWRMITKGGVNTRNGTKENEMRKKMLEENWRRV